MPRITRGFAGEKTPRKTAAPSPQQKRAATASRKKFEAENPEKFSEVSFSPEEKGQIQARQQAVSKQFETHLSAEDVRSHLADTSKGTLPLDYEPVIKGEAARRTRETVGQAEKLGTGASWEDFSPARKKIVLDKLAGFGINQDSAFRSFSAQVSRGMAAGLHHDTDPYASGFYHVPGSRGPIATPRQQITNTAKDYGVGFHVAATAHAMMSPQLPFEHRRGEGTFAHNDDAARQVLHFAKSGADMDKLTSKDLEHLHPNARSVEKMREAVHVTRQLLNGVSLSDVTTRKGKDPFGDKTGAYLHAWLNPNSADPRLTVDTHTGMGFFQHLGKSDKDKVLAIPGAHAFFDHVGKQVMQHHGLSNIHWTQATQWGQQRIEAKQISKKEAYRPYEKTSTHVPQQPRDIQSHRDHFDHGTQETLF